ncbi:MAG: hypothetical protein C5B49_12630 [Bdellovibrio sp.]|nr:MAG: hypothetical protein C5B49_12630 [Bdellovibrio sp.]
MRNLTRLGLFSPFFILLFLLIAGPAPLAPAKQDRVDTTPAETDCFARHISEAMALNRQRFWPYARLTSWRSVLISSELIATEAIALLVAQRVDRKARMYQERGIPIACNDFAPMSLVVSFSAREPAPFPDLRDYDYFFTGPWITTLSQLADGQDYAGLEQKTNEVLQVFAKEPRFHCMSKHVLDSLRRLAHFAPDYLRMAAEKELPPPTELIQGMIHNHLQTLPIATHLDDDSRFIHAEGIPLICQDVPAIGLDPLPQYRDLFDRDH